jgi:fructoselysine 6-kinase
VTNASGSRFVCAGDNCVDRYLGGQAADLVGGNALNVAVDLSLAGRRSSYLGTMGADPEGRAILAALRHADVDASGVRVGFGQSGLTVVDLNRGERRFVSEDYGLAATFRLEADEVLAMPGVAWLHGARLVDGSARAHTGLWPVDRARLDSTSHAFRELVHRGLRLSYDFTDRWQADVLRALCPFLTVAFFSGAGLDDDDARSAAEDAVTAGAVTAVVTRGAAGALALSGECLIERPAEPITLVDTLGAGDALIAGYIGATVDAGGVSEALDAGAQAAAVACTHRGAWTIDDHTEARRG